jgi:two-component system, chemotaxis family, chemotaxis protein CheY
VKILIVDDSKTMRYVLIMQLKELGYDTFVEADCVDKAKHLCSGDPPSLVISDWNMPNASGLDFLKFIRNNARTSEVPFIMLTTETDRDKIIEATRAGLQSYLLKPIRKTILIEKMRELATAYGFTPPREGNIVHGTRTVAMPDESHPLQGKLKKDQIAKILDIYGRVWQNEITITEYENLIAKEIFNDPLKSNPDDIELFMKTVLIAAQDAINYKLNQFVV